MSHSPSKGRSINASTNTHRVRAESQHDVRSGEEWQELRVGECLQTHWHSLVVVAGLRHA